VFLAGSRRRGADDRLTAAVPPLAPGPWRVEWQDHVDFGRFEFRLALAH
jgi:hypothetical protein